MNLFDINNTMVKVVRLVDIVYAYQKHVCAKCRHICNAFNLKKLASILKGSLLLYNMQFVIFVTLSFYNAMNVLCFDDLLRYQNNT